MTTMTLKYFAVRAMMALITVWLVLTLMYLSLHLSQWLVWSRGEAFADFASRVWSLYVEHMKGILTRWDWGRTKDGLDAWEVLLMYAPNTLWFNFLAFAIYIPLSIVLGLLAGAFRGRIFDKLITFPMHVFSSVPNFIWYFFFILFFGYTLYWFPIVRPPESAGFFETIKFWVLPIAALSLLPLSKYSLLVRAEYAETRDADYNLLLRTKGLTRWQMFYRHRLKHCVAPVLPEVAPTFVFVFASSFLLEQMGYLYGASALLMDALIKQLPARHIDIDINMAVLIVTFYVVIGLLVTIAVDMLYVLVEPRMRLGSKKTEIDAG